MTFSEQEAERQFAQRIVLAKDARERAQILSEKHANSSARGDVRVRQVGIPGISHAPGPRLRRLNKDAVRDIAKSMAEIGMLNPLTVKRRANNTFELICGAHRLEAAKLLKWSAVPVIVIDGQEDGLAQIDENLRREELTPIERAFHLARAKELYEARHPETAAKAIQSRHAKSVNSKRREAATAPDERAIGKPYRHAAAADLGVKPAAIDESVRFSKIPNIRLAMGTCLDGAPQLRELHKIQKSNPVKVQDIISRASAGEKVSAIEPSHAAEELAAWIAKRARAVEIPMIVSWLHAVAAKGVGVALRRMAASQREV